MTLNFGCGQQRRAEHACLACFLDEDHDSLAPAAIRQADLLRESAAALDPADLAEAANHGYVMQSAPLVFSGGDSRGIVIVGQRG